MAGGVIKISPSLLYGGSSVTSQNAGAADDLTNTMLTEFNTFLSLLSPLADQPIIGPGATALMAALDQTGYGLAGALACFGTGLHILAPAMIREGQSFSSLDSSLASTLRELDGMLPQVESYATSVKLITPTAAELKGLSEYATAAQQKHGSQYKATTVAIQVQAPHQGGFLGWLHRNSWAAWTAAGLITIGGVGLTLFTGGGSDAGALAADTAILGGDAAATTVDTAAATGIAATAGTDAALTTVGGAVEFTAPAEAIDTGVLAQIDQIEAWANAQSLLPAGG